MHKTPYYLEMFLSTTSTTCQLSFHKSHNVFLLARMGIGCEEVISPFLPWKGFGLPGILLILFFGFCISEQWLLMHSEVVLFLNFGYLSLHAKAKPKGTFIRYTITWQFWATKSGCSLRYMHAQFMLTRMSALTDRSHNAPCHLKFCQVIQDHLKLLVHRLVGCAYYSTITMSMSHNFWDIGYSHI